MSVSPLDIIMGRIEAATPASPIAVFKVRAAGRGIELDAVFGATVIALGRIRRDPGYLGSFYSEQNKADTRRYLRNAGSSKTLRS